MALYLVGDLEPVGALRRNAIHGTTIEFEDTGVSLLQSPAGGKLRLTIVLTHINLISRKSYSFVREGTVKIGGQYLNILEYQMVEDGHVSVEESNRVLCYGTYTGSMSNHDLVYKNVYDVPLSPLRSW